LLLAVGAATLLTVLITLTSAVRLDYRSPPLHVAVETTAALVSLLAAQMMYGRFRRSLDRGDLLLASALALFAASNLLFSAIPAAADGFGPFATWTSAAGSATATAVLAVGAYAPRTPLHRPAMATRQAAGLCALALALIALAGMIAGDALPRAIDPGLAPPDASIGNVGPAAMIVVQILLCVLLATAAAGFTHRAERIDDPLTVWFAVGAALGAGSRLNYALFPSLYSDYFYTGDVLRLAFFVALMLGGAHEIRVAQRELERAAVFGERRRLAREVHDGIAQELAFIVQQGDHLAGKPGAPEVFSEITTAARRALDESRSVISVLSRPAEEPLGTALTRLAEDTAGRWGTEVNADTEQTLEVPVPAREALLRIVGEAVTNAVRHGGARTIHLRLRADPHLHLSIDDDGSGFDPAAVATRHGGHGITGMRERVEELGGELLIASRAGEGTQVSVVLP
jgi:signal transduction histidine kinase